MYNLFTTSDPPNIQIPILQILVFVIEGRQENIFLLVKKIFSTNRKMFSCPPSITKTNIWRIGIRIFGESDVVNKLIVVVKAKIKNSKLMIANSWNHAEFGEQLILMNVVNIAKKFPRSESCIWIVYGKIC